MEKVLCDRCKQEFEIRVYPPKHKEVLCSDCLSDSLDRDDLEPMKLEDIRF